MANLTGQSIRDARAQRRRSTAPAYPPHVTDERPLAARQSQARHELATLPHGGRNEVLLRVQCSRSHHVARVLHTAEGLVVETHPRSYGHGDRDRYDGTHHASPRMGWTDFLDASDDPIPAGCECGPVTLDRAELRRLIGRGTLRWVMSELE